MVVQPKIKKRLKQIIAKENQVKPKVKGKATKVADPVAKLLDNLEKTKQGAEEAKSRVEQEVEAIKVAKGTPKGKLPEILIPNAMVIDEQTKSRIFVYVPPEDIPFDSFEKKYSGFQRKYNGLYLHLLRLDRECNYTPLPRAKTEKGRSPIDLYTNMHCALEVEETYGLSMPTTEKIKWGIFITLIIGIIITVFLISAS